jgi:hypothetical protein
MARHVHLSQNPESHSWLATERHVAVRGHSVVGFGTSVIVLRNDLCLQLPD